MLWIRGKIKVNIRVNIARKSHTLRLGLEHHFWWLTCHNSRLAFDDNHCAYSKRFCYVLRVPPPAVGGGSGGGAAAAVVGATAATAASSTTTTMLPSLSL